MRIQVVMVLGALLIAVAVIGIAAAEPESIEPDPEEYNYDIPTDGTSITIVLKVQGFTSGWEPGQSHSMTAFTAGASAGHEGDLRYIFTCKTGEPSEWLTSGEIFQWTDNSDPDYVTLKIKALGNPPAGVDYDITIEDEWVVGEPSQVDFGACTIFLEAIPEFTTIALPIATVLGLMFFFKRRAQRKK